MPVYMAQNSIIPSKHIHLMGLTCHFGRVHLMIHSPGVHFFLPRASGQALMSSPGKVIHRGGAKGGIWESEPPTPIGPNILVLFKKILTK